MSVDNFVEHDRRGFSISGNEPFDPSKFCNKEGEVYKGALQIERVSWTDKNRTSHEMSSHHLLVEVLPDRSGLICVESATKSENLINGAFVLNEDASLRFRLEVPLDLITGDVPTTASRSFIWIEHSAFGYGLMATIEGVGDFYFELDHQSGRFLWGKPARF